MSDRTPDIRKDDGAGLRIIARAANPGSGAFGNNSMGFGTGRDPTTHIHVNRPGRLTDRELADLYQDGIVGKIVDAFPVECADVWMKYTFARQTNYRGYGVDGDAIEDYLDNRVEPSEDLDPLLSLSSVKTLFREQSISARIFRSAYILIGVDDGRDYREAIDINNIRSIQYLEPLYHTDLYPDKKGAFQLSRGRSDNRDMPFNGTIHPSRIIRFSGKAKPRYLRTLEAEEDYSAIDGVFKALSRAEQSLDALNYYIQTASVFDYGLDGFSDIRQEEDGTSPDEEAIAQRMQSVMLALSALRIFIRDKDREEMKTVSRNFGGVGDALDRLVDAIAFYTDIPRHVIMGTSNAKGLSNQGKEGTEERQWDDLKIAWRTRHWADYYLYLGKLACLAKDSPTGGRLPKGLGVEVPSGLKRSDTDKLANMKTFAEAAEILVGLGSIHEYEVRQAFSGDEPNFNLVLDDRVSDRLNDAVDEPEALEGELVDEEEQKLLEAANTDSNTPTDKDLWARCVAKAKEKFTVYPSAYANSYAAKEYKRLGGEWRSDDLREWHEEKWVNIATGKECGEGDTDSKGKPKCLPKAKAASLSEEEKQKLVRRKRSKDPNASRSGKPINVSSKLDEENLDADVDRVEERADGSWLVWFGGRRTPIGISAESRSEAISKARKKKKRGGENVASARQANASEKKTAANGGWIRTGPNGEKPGESKLRGHGPKPGSRKDEEELLGDAEWDAIAAIGEDQVDEAMKDLVE